VSVVAFMLARAGNPAHMAGSATGLVNCGGFLAGSVAILSAGLLLDHDAHTAVAFPHALLPMLGFSALSLMQLARLPFAAIRVACGRSSSAEESERRRSSPTGRISHPS
jgi:hypothetical protein